MATDPEVQVVVTRATVQELKDALAPFLFALNGVVKKLDGIRDQLIDVEEAINKLGELS